MYIHVHVHLNTSTCTCTCSCFESTIQYLHYITGDNKSLSCLGAFINCLPKHLKIAQSINYYYLLTSLN